MRQRTNEAHMRAGVTLIDPTNTYIDVDVQIGADTVIEPNVYLKGQTKIGSHVVLTSGTTIVDSMLLMEAQIDAIIWKRLKYVRQQRSVRLLIYVRQLSS